MKNFQSYVFEPIPVWEKLKQERYERKYDNNRQMKNDSKCEAWILGYTVKNRSASNPFAVMGAASFCVERFGASIEEHRGESVSKSASNSSSSEEETWWAKRHRKITERLISAYNTASLL